MWPNDIDVNVRRTAFLACDLGGFGTVFIRQFTMSEHGLIAIRDYNMDGSVYGPRGAIVPHPHQEYALLMKPIRDYHFDVARGKIGGHSTLVVLGRHPDVDTATAPQVVWTGGLASNPDSVFLATPRPLQVRSTSALDTAGGTGAQSVSVTVLDANYDRFVLTVALNGTTPVPLGTFFRVNQVRALRPDTPTVRGSNAGEIIVETANAPLVRLSHMAPGAGRAQQAIFTVPRGFSAYLTNYRPSMSRTMEGASGALFEVRTWTPGGTWTVRNIASRHYHGVNDAAEALRIPPAVLEKTDFVVMCTMVTNNNTLVSANCQFVLIDITLPDATTGVIPLDTCIDLESGSVDDIDLESGLGCIDTET